MEKPPIEESKIKEIIDIEFKESLLNREQLSLLSHISTHYYSQIHNVISSFIPKNMKEKLLK
jgi:primosomal protein N'